MGTWQAILLGLVQGLTEFLPISSSAHLVLAQSLLGIEPPGLSLEIAVHLGTLAAVVAVFARDLGELLRAAGRLVGAGARGAWPRGWPAREPGAALLATLVLASLVTASVGLAAEPWLRGAFEEPRVAAALLLVTGGLLWGAGRISPGTRSVAAVDWRDGLLVGVAQGVAILPGISRSGTTIAALLWRGSSTALAPRFSFLMYLVASLGVAALTIPELSAAELEPAPALAMFVTSFGVGYLAILWLFSVLRRGKFRWFAPYLWGIAALTLAHVALS